MKIQIVLEDTPNGHVRVKVTPALQRIVQDALSQKRTEFTPAENYAFVMANAVREASENLNKYDPKRIIIPGEF